MSNDSKKEYLNEVKYRYRNSTKQQKTIILNEFCNVCNYNRKYAISLLNNTNKTKPYRKKKRGR